MAKHPLGAPAVLRARQATRDDGGVSACQHAQYRCSFSIISALPCCISALCCPLTPFSHTRYPQFREFDKLHAATVLTLFTVCWFGTHWGKLTQEARRKAAEERRQAKLREMAAANNAGGANNNKGKAVTSGNSSKPKKQR